jgi:phosphatidyl-myo-inositol alpha-mannosyltransferase
MPARMNIVQVSPYSLDRKGGVQHHIKSLSRALETRGHRVLVIGPGAENSGEPGRLNLGRMRMISFAGTAFEITQASKSDMAWLDMPMQDFKPDIIHYHTMWVPMLPWQIFRRYRAPSIATFHDTTSNDATGAILRTVFKPLSRYLLSKLDGAITVSTSPLAHLRPGKHGVIPQIIPPVVDLAPFFAIQKPHVHAQPLVLFVGRLEPRKGIRVLLDAWSIVATAHSTATPHLIVAGSGELQGDVIAAQQQLGPKVITHFPAPTDEKLRELMAMATIAVSPAIYGESFGIVLAEALASGTPIIGAANPGYVQVLTGEGAELLVGPGNAKALAGKIMDLLADPMRIRSLGAWGRTHAAQFDAAANAHRFEAAYGDAIARHNKS